MYTKAFITGNVKYMKLFTRRMVFFLLVVAFLFTGYVNAQSLMQPTDVLQTYNSAAAVLPPKPDIPYDNNIHQWYRGNKRLITDWGGNNTDSYKAYIYKSQTFRLKFPKTYVPGVNDGKRYPMLVFLHGLGEVGTWLGDQYAFFENEYHLLWGGKLFRDAVDNGTYDGYILFMQVQKYGWDIGQYTAIKEIADYMVINNKLDPFAITDNGLSGGGLATWALMTSQPTLIAGSLPMSGASVQTLNDINIYRYTPIWIFQGGNDGSQPENTTWQLVNGINAGGGRIQWNYYPNQGHNTWEPAFNNPNFLPFIKASYASNPWPLNYNSTQPPPPNAPVYRSLDVNVPISFYFTTGASINIPMGVAPGFSNYEWRLNGAIIPGANVNTYTANKPGKYEVRLTKNGVVSEWSRVPILIFLNGALPVNWVSFTGNLASEGIELKWQVENNEQAQYYQIEHSTDGVNFSKVDELPNIKDIKAYKYLYKTKEAGKHYFRILQVDFDRKFIFSKVIVIPIKGDKNYSVRLISNPVQNDNADIEIAATRPGRALIEIWSNSGAKISSRQQQVASGNNRLQIPLNGAAAGVYLIKVQIGDAIVTEKLMKN